MIIEVNSEAEMKDLGNKLGLLLAGGEVIELVGDVGAGKTTFTKGVAAGLSITDDVQSPSFTISRMYAARDNLQLAHYDFYRLSDAGIMAYELAEVTENSQTITIVEWAEAVESVLPKERLQVRIVSPSVTGRTIELVAQGERYQQLIGKLA